MSDGYVLIFDSGNGGQFVLNLFKSLLPNEKYILFKDVAHCPYGNKTKDELENIFFSTIYKLNYKYYIKAIVIACNTMSSMFGERLRKNKLLPRVFLIKPILNKKIIQQPTLFLATTNTCKYNKDVKKYIGCHDLYLLPLATFAKEIDDNINDKDKLEKKVRSLLSPFKKHDIKNVIIGCTHYNYIRGTIEQELKGVKIYEKSLFIVNKTVEYLVKNNLISNKKSIKILEKI